MSRPQTVPQVFAHQPASMLHGDKVIVTGEQQADASQLLGFLVIDGLDNLRNKRSFIAIMKVQGVSRHLNILAVN